MMYKLASKQRKRDFYSSYNSVIHQDLIALKITRFAEFIYDSEFGCLSPHISYHKMLM